jgi:tRNA G18 (ribose-2'-O)-methylase SpoU
MKQLTPSELQRPELEAYKQAEKMPVRFVLDNVRSGLNVGAMFRTCDAFSIEAIYLCGITVHPPHPEILKTALGASESVPWKFFKTTHEALDELIRDGYTLLPVEQTDHAVLLHEIIFEALFPLALIFGNEMKGVDATVLKRCEQSLEIPQSGIKHSINVATSAGIVLWECYRQYLLRRPLGSGL